MASSGVIKLHIVQLSGTDLITVTTEPTATVSSVRNKLVAKVGREWLGADLLTEDEDARVLDATSTLESAGLKDGCSLQAIKREREPSDLHCPDEDECHNLKRHLQIGPIHREEVFARLEGNILELARLEGTYVRGSQIVRLAFEKCNSEQVSVLLEELHGNVCTMSACPNDHQVLRMVIARLPSKQWTFIASELAGNLVAIAKDRYGSLVLCEICNRCTTTAATAALVDEILSCATELIQHRYGHHIIESIVERGAPEQKHRTANELLAHLPQFMKNWSANVVLQKMLKHCAEADQLAITQSLLTCFAQDEGLAIYPCGKLFGLVLKIQARHQTVATDCLQRLATVLSQSGPRDEGLIAAIDTFKVQSAVTVTKAHSHVTDSIPKGSPQSPSRK